MGDSCNHSDFRILSRMLDPRGLDCEQARAPLSNRPMTLGHIVLQNLQTVQEAGRLRPQEGFWQLLGSTLSNCSLVDIPKPTASGTVVHSWIRLTRSGRDSLIFMVALEPVVPILETT